MDCTAQHPDPHQWLCMHCPLAAAGGGILIGLCSVMYVICAEEKSEGPTFSKRTISLLGDLVYRQTETAAVDLQLFARHAKRTTVTMEDVKLISRRSDTIVRLPTSNPTSIPLVLVTSFLFSLTSHSSPSSVIGTH
jgi:hypothetical protein